LSTIFCTFYWKAQDRDCRCEQNCPTWVGLLKSSFYRVCEDFVWGRIGRCTWWESFWFPLLVGPRNVCHHAQKYIFFLLVEHRAKTCSLWSYIYRLAQIGRAQDPIYLFGIAGISPPLTSNRQRYRPRFFWPCSFPFRILDADKKLRKA